MLYQYYNNGVFFVYTSCFCSIVQDFFLSFDWKRVLEQRGLIVLSKAADIHNTEIVPSNRNAVLPVIRLHGDQENGEDDNDTYHN